MGEDAVKRGLDGWLDGMEGEIQVVIFGCLWEGRL